MYRREMSQISNVELKPLASTWMIENLYFKKLNNFINVII